MTQNFEPKMKNAHLDELNDELEFLANGNKNGFNGRRRSHDNIVEEGESDDSGTEDAAADGVSVTASAKMGSLAAAAQNGRLIRKAKRINRTLSLSEEGKFGSSGQGASRAEARNMKNSKKSRSGLGRGLPKKGKRRHCKSRIPNVRPDSE
jgi:hypothetical protein